MEMVRQAEVDVLHDLLATRAAEELEGWTTRTTEGTRAGSRREHLRHGDLTLNVETGVLRCGVHQVTLTRAEREVLGVLLTRAGQILSPQQLARLLETDEGAVEERLARLTVTLSTAGIRYKPRRAAGLGYIFWA